MVRGASSGARGRGRGRGARAAASAQPPPESATSAGNDAAADPPAPATSSQVAASSSTPLSISPSTTPSTTPAPTANPTIQPRTTAPTREPTRASASARSGRLRPRNVRRNEEQREQLAQQEAKKDSERAAEERRLRGRTRFRGRRGRGNQFGPRTSRVEPSGLFQHEHGVGGSSRGGGGFGGGRGGYKREGGSRRHPGYKYEEEDSWEMRINTDKLGVSAAATEEDPEEERTHMAVSSQPGPKPLGITRREEKERETVVVTTAELEAQQGTAEEDSMWVSGSGSDSPVEAPADDGKIWHAAPSDLTQIKTEEGELRSVNPDVPMIDFDANRKVPLEETGETEAKPVIPKPKPKKPSDYNVDTEEQWEEESVQYILKTLAAASLKEKKDEDEEESSVMADPQPFLCKFGPIMPPLRPRDRPGPTIKDEPTDTPMMDQIAPVDLTRASTAAAEEEDVDPFKYGGYVGKLVVRKSGKAELDYGGIKYSMRRGIKSSGVTSYVVLEEEDVKPGQQEQYAGRAVAMGSLMGKFNFGPVWEEQEEWVVSEEELKIPQADDEA